ESVIVAGGVACNLGLRERALGINGPAFYFPLPGLSTDNAAMIAAAAFPKYEQGLFAGFDLKAQASLMLA
ncbi:MAG: tRNA (adenosine(37)-N6)-threonylcarbamoyltransferase complex transferase subunit TsaD, partial [Acidobacteriaceae bacterium]|nr:tRNA (adenosine(37)-N6)-threonylcarbamoyltransferase complex transferase subunit TsaD [Acidobacteriaceae bacterium]